MPALRNTSSKESLLPEDTNSRWTAAGMLDAKPGSRGVSRNPPTRAVAVERLVVRDYDNWNRGDESARLASDNQARAVIKNAATGHLLARSEPTAVEFSRLRRGEALSERCRP
jgi:hypothetical protein